MASVYINIDDRKALWEAYCVLDELQADVISDKEIERYRKAKKRVFNIWKKSKNKKKS